MVLFRLRPIPILVLVITVTVGCSQDTTSNRSHASRTAEDSRSGSQSAESGDRVETHAENPKADTNDTGNASVGETAKQTADAQESSLGQTLDSGEPSRPRFDHEATHGMFVSSEEFSATLHGGVANRHCQRLADAAGLGGSWSALIYDIPPIGTERQLDEALNISKPVLNMRGEELAATKEEFFRKEGLKNAIRYDESGKDAGAAKVWTGIAFYDEWGFVAVYVANCWAWVAGSSYRGLVGFADSKERWYSGVTQKNLPLAGDTCDQKRRIYCFSK